MSISTLFFAMLRDQKNNDFGIHFDIILVAFWHTFRSFFDVDFCTDFWIPLFRTFGSLWAPLGLLFRFLGTNVCQNRRPLRTLGAWPFFRFSEIGLGAILGSILHQFWMSSELLDTLFWCIFLGYGALNVEGLGIYSPMIKVMQVVACIFCM